MLLFARSLLLLGTLKPFADGCSRFFLQGGLSSRRGTFSLRTPSTARNAMRLLRALSLSKPVLLEGSPGVGKTSLVAALAAASGHALVRINLSEQSDMMDLLGADLPAAGGDAAEFAWADGPLLSALRSGAWVLLDELNLAPQAVLEGLNALLDHRREVYVPELDKVRTVATRLA
jgi:midasin